LIAVHEPTPMHTITFSLAAREPDNPVRLADACKTCVHVVRSMSTETKSNIRFTMELVIFALAVGAAVKAFVLLPSRMDNVEKAIAAVETRNNSDHDVLIELRTNVANMTRDVTEIKAAVKQAAYAPVGR